MAETNCLFCKIVEKEIPAKIVHEDDDIVAFEDINKAAPFHVLIIPKKHFANINEMKEEDKELIGKMFLAAKKMAHDENIDTSGYRCVFNTNKDAGQAVFHIHMHVLGGRPFTWPPG
jgi:histidine triad (HIT) family protein